MRCGHEGLHTTDRIHRGESAIVSIQGFVESDTVVGVLRPTAAIGDFAIADDAPTLTRDSLSFRDERSIVARGVRLVTDAG